jgi:multiple sugar transport system substrate-binding protein
MPDVIHLDASSAAVFIDNGVLRDLSPSIARDPTFRIDDYFESVVAIARRSLVPPASSRQAHVPADQATPSGAALYAVPLDFTPMVIYYNKTLFDNAGVPYPADGWTWDDFLAAAKALTITPDGADRPTQYGFNFINWMPAWLLWLWANDADVLDESGRRATGAFDAPRSIEAIQFIVNLMTKHHVAPTLTESSAAGVDLFRAGRAAMDLKGHWMMIDYRADGIDFGVVSLPTRTGTPVTVVYAAGLGITQKAKHPELAWEYVKFMTSREVQIRRVAAGLAISANKQAAAHFADNPIEAAFLRYVPHARPPWGARVERYPVVEDLGRETMEDILYGNVEVQEALKRTARLMDAALAQP